MWDGYHVRLDRVIEASDQAVALVHVSGVAILSGVPLDQTVSHAQTWRGGLTFRTVAYVDHAEALKAVGLEV